MRKSNDKQSEAWEAEGLNITCGNIKSLKRYSTRTLTYDFTYDYNGNQLTGIQNGDNGIVGQTYDYNGNLTKSDLDSMEFQYNYLNLISTVSHTYDEMSQSYYTYTTDGTKLSVKDASGVNGKEYLGSMVYTRANGMLSLESATFGTGQIIASTSNVGTTYEPHYFLTDHLGSVCSVVNSTGVVQTQNDYYALGGRWADVNSLISNNRYLYNDKELQSTGNFQLLDYGARMYNPRIGR